MLENLFKDYMYIDFWSLMHILTGGFLAFIFLKKFKFNFQKSFLIVLFLAILWEVIEPSFYIYILNRTLIESIYNQVLDVLFNLMGFLIFWFYVKRYS